MNKGAKKYCQKMLGRCWKPVIIDNYQQYIETNLCIIFMDTETSGPFLVHYITLQLEIALEDSKQPFYYPANGEKLKWI